MKVILTGGAGYIGTHVLLELLASDWQVDVIDNFCNSSPKALERVRDLAGSDFEAFHLDLLDESAVADALKAFRPDAVVHLAGLKAIGESVAQPLRYYENNVLGSLKLLRAMHAAGCGRIVFSSSASVYGVPESVPLDETHRLSPVNPYGQCKQFIEQIVRDWIAAGDGASGFLLRYFNPAGAHESGRVGEDPSGVPKNLVPLISQIAAGRHESLTVFGDDYDTRDGTGERDYVHVVDLARAHVEALNHTLARTGCETFNIGTGRGATVMEILAAFERASGIAIRLGRKYDMSVERAIWTWCNSSFLAAGSHGRLGRSAYGKFGLGARLHCCGGPAPEMATFSECTKPSPQGLLRGGVVGGGSGWCLPRRIYVHGGHHSLA